MPCLKIQILKTGERHFFAVMRILESGPLYYYFEVHMDATTEMFDPVVKTQKLLMVALNVTSGCYRRTLLAVIVRQ